MFRIEKYEYIEEKEWFIGHIFYKANIENFADMLKLIEDSSYYIERLKE